MADRSKVLGGRKVSTGNYAETGNRGASRRQSADFAPHHPEGSPTEERRETYCDLPNYDNTEQVHRVVTGEPESRMDLPNPAVKY
jgi:hypothetical protein